MPDVKKISIEALQKYASNLRTHIINAVKKNGGHLASNLGVVEIVLAMHRVFDAKNDKFIFDVGHQCYVHKMLTGRAEAFADLRKSGGISGFPNPLESPCDAFVTGHSGTSVSLACGYLRARRAEETAYRVVVLIGDGAMTGGMIHEALYDLRGIEGKAIIIINDNGRPYGGQESGFSAYLDDIRKGLIKKPFEEYGLAYLGPVDGHDLNALTKAFLQAESEEQSVIIHAITTKGKGMPEAENEPEKYHGLPRPGASATPDTELLEGAFCASCGVPTDANGAVQNRVVGSAAFKTFSQIAGEAVCECAQKDLRVAAVTAAMRDGTGFADFAARFSDRFFDVGICEDHAVTMSAALSRQGLIPYVAVYSSFLQRAFDSIVHDVGIMSNNVRFLIDRAGLVPEDGETHQGIFDVGFLSLIPEMTVLSPKDGGELRTMIEWSLKYKGPLAIRYPKAKTCDTSLNAFNSAFNGLSQCSEFMVGNYDFAPHGSNDAVKRAFHDKNIHFKGAAVKKDVYAADGVGYSEVADYLQRSDRLSDGQGGVFEGILNPSSRNPSRKNFVSYNANDGLKRGVCDFAVKNAVNYPDFLRMRSFGRENAPYAVVVSGAVMLSESLKAAEICQRTYGFETEIFYAAALKPFDRAGLSGLADKKHIFVIEDNAPSGGLGSEVSAFFAEYAKSPPVHRFAVESGYPARGTRSELLRTERLDATSLAARMSAIVKKL
ncbi:MAG: 1-deoxy-D-xylulose-5-phosphate synthase [Clostridiales bacterium]|nr:1-deoxy-D-xylulose-5-phosphate synthase [Clostridiales bacterium]